MTSREIRQSFLDFFREKDHTIVPSASLMPTSPNLLFTNAGMNQFVPYFLGSESAPYDPPRAADTQKCIRAGGKHNDLEDVGYDTYHHTLFEMLGNWSFGDYFKAEAIAWAWELLTERWKIPPLRIYATVYRPGPGDPAEFDQEAHDHWAAIFEKAGLDPAVHIVDGDKKDNFWMMGDTGPCGPCSELHIDLTPEGDTKGSLVNQDHPLCIEVWNLVFIQFNAEPDGSFKPLPACHVDTGMGFERIVSIIQCTDGLTDFSKPVSNYDTDVFSPIFQKLSELSGKEYTATLPEAGQSEGLSEQEKIDVAFRVIADHIRTLSFSVADGILPSNEGRGYVLRRILRRAVRFGRTLGLTEPFFYQLVDVLADTMGEVFPEIRTRKEQVIATLRNEEDSFNKTLDKGIQLFESAASDTESISGEDAFKLYDTYGFPLDLTELMARERGLAVDVPAFETLMEEQRQRARKDYQEKKGVVTAETEELDVKPTEFLGYDYDEAEAVVEAIIPSEEDGEFQVILDKTPCYAEMGGQVGDTGLIHVPGHDRTEVGRLKIFDTVKKGDAFVHLAKLIDGRAPEPGEAVRVSVNRERRDGIESHHTATHLFHWALHEAVSRDAAQQGSLVAEDRLRFDFNSQALNNDQIAEIETLVNRCVTDDQPISATEVPHEEVKDRADVMQFFGDKYGDEVRVVQIGGTEGKLDGYSMELCGGTHVNRTGDIGLFKVRSEGAIAAGIRRIEAVCGDSAVAFVQETAQALEQESTQLADKLTSANARLEEAGADPIAVPVLPSEAASGCDLENQTGIEAVNAWLEALTQHRDTLKQAAIEADKKLKKASAGAAAAEAAQWLDDAIAKAEGDSPKVMVAQLPGDNPALLQEAMNGVKARQFPGIAVLALVADGTVHVGAVVHADFTGAHKAGDLVRELTAIVGGKGGGKPEMARGAGRETDQVDAMLEKAKALLF